MKVWIVTAEHFHVPGLMTSVHASERDAIAEAVAITAGMVADNGGSGIVSPENWREHVERLQDEHGAQYCYVDVDEHEVRGAPPPIHILVGVRGGVAEIDDATNWPAGLTIYIADYDNGDEADPDTVDVAGMCSLAAYDGTFPVFSGDLVAAAIKADGERS